MLDRIPLEVLDRILLLCDPIDLASLSKVCQLTHRRIRHNNNLWQRIFLSHFDDPCESRPVIRSAFESHPSTIKRPQNPNQIDWRSTLIARITLRQTLGTTEEQLFTHRLIKHYSADQLTQLYQLLFLILYTARSPLLSSSGHYSNPRHAILPHSDSHNLRFLSDLLSNPAVQLHLFHLPAVQGEHPEDVSASSGRLYRHVTDADKPDRFLPAKLHTLFGLTAFDLGYPRTRGLARESSYLLPNYSSDNLYGPFIPFQSTRVNWFHLQDLGLVVGLNLHKIHTNHESQLDSQQHSSDNQHSNSRSSPLPNLPVDPPPFTMPDTFGYPHQPVIPPPHILRSHTQNDPTHHQAQQLQDHQPEHIDWPILNSLQSAIPYTQVTKPSHLHPTLTWPPCSNLEDPDDLNYYDWAGVTGKWLRVVCFLDYRDLHDYNFDRSSSSRLDDLIEVVRVMTLDLEVVSIGDPPDHSHPIPMDLRTDLPHRPPIFFKGTLTYNVGVSSTPIIGQSVSTLRGCVSMTIDDEVRWSTVSTSRGEDKWASEGIQVGGVQSKWGVLGVWTDVDREEIEGPVGPFYFFKTSY